jgi:predicted nucleic acid-binding protein
MNKLLIDTMYIEEIFSSEETIYTKFADAIDDEKIIGISSAIILVDVDQRIAQSAGELRLRYDIPTIDSMIAATGIVESVKHVLTRDVRHFESLKNIIKIIDLKTALKIAR